MPATGNDRPQVDQDPKSEARKIEGLGQKSLEGGAEGRDAAHKLADEASVILSSPNLAYRDALNKQFNADGNSGMSLQFRAGEGNLPAFLEIDKLTAGGKQISDWQQYGPDRSRYTSDNDQLGTSRGNDRTTPALPDFLQAHQQSATTAQEAKTLEGLAQTALNGNDAQAQQAAQQKLAELIKGHSTDKDQSKIDALNEQFAFDKGNNPNLPNLTIMPRAAYPGESGNTFNLQVADAKNFENQQLYSSGMDPKAEQTTEEHKRDWLEDEVLGRMGYDRYGHSFAEQFKAWAYNTNSTDQEQRNELARTFGLDVKPNQTPTWQDLETAIPGKMRQDLMQQYPGDTAAISQYSPQQAAGSYQEMQGMLHERKQVADMLGLDAGKLGALGSDLTKNSEWPEIAGVLGSKDTDWGHMGVEAFGQEDGRNETLSMIPKEILGKLKIDPDTLQNSPLIGAQDEAARKAIAEQLGIPDSSTWMTISDKTRENVHHNTEYANFFSRIFDSHADHTSLWPYTSND